MVMILNGLAEKGPASTAFFKAMIAQGSAAAALLSDSDRRRRCKHQKAFHYSPPVSRSR